MLFEFLEIGGNKFFDFAPSFSFESFGFFNCFEGVGYGFCFFGYEDFFLTTLLNIFG
jgi:hypothetical protein